MTIFNTDRAASLDQMIRRYNDLAERFSLLTDVLIQGRLTDRVPTSSSDIVDGEKVGDINFQNDYIYILTDNAGTPAWRRVAVSSF